MVIHDADSADAFIIRKLNMLSKGLSTKWKWGLFFLGKMAGHPTPSVRWLKNEQDFEPDGARVKSFVNDDGTFGLIFESTEAADKGTYTAIAFSDEGMARSNANVAIKSRMKEGVEKSAPTFGRPMGDVAVDEGAKLRITTPVKGNPIPEFTWTKDGKPLSGDRVHAFSDGELVNENGFRKR